MSCNLCPLQEICQTAMEFDRQGKLFEVESAFQELQNQRLKEWQELASQLPIYIDADDQLEGHDQAIVKADASILAAHEALDRLEYVLDRNESAAYIDRAQLMSDEIGCPGPTDMRRWKFLGGTPVLVCSSPARQERALKSEAMLNINHD